MKIERIDHLHIKAPDFGKFTEAFEKIMGHRFSSILDYVEMFGTFVHYEPFPIGIELFDPQKPSVSVDAAIAEASPPGVFAISFKVKSVKDAKAELEGLGYKMLEYHDFGPIQEALFDTRDDLGILIELIEYPGDNIKSLNVEI